MDKKSAEIIDSNQRNVTKACTTCSKCNMCSKCECFNTVKCSKTRHAPKEWLQNNEMFENEIKNR